MQSKQQICFFTLKCFFRGEALACSAALLEKIGSESLMNAANDKSQTLKCLQRCEDQIVTPTLSSSFFQLKKHLVAIHFSALLYTK
jgi:hypothetical protein